MSETWASAFRIFVGLFWLYFASTKWQSVDWTRGLIQSAAADNPIPGLKEFLAGVVAPNWFVFSVAQTVAETVVAILLILGLATRWAGIAGLLLAANLALVIAFEVKDPGFRWLYYLAVLVNAQIIVSGAGSMALARFKWVPAFLR
ncbi:MAG TPA: DoxX family membrane protein [Candidatus Dormibacteraeota bacterium]|jgi:uncharacterized membrane protein YphA (DoxX/SURF4 family)